MFPLYIEQMSIQHESYRLSIQFFLKILLRAKKLSRIKSITENYIDVKKRENSENYQLQNGRSLILINTQNPYYVSVVSIGLKAHQIEAWLIHFSA